MILLASLALAGRPAASYTEDHASRALRCHAIDGAEGLCPEVLAALDEAWTAQVDGLGFQAPLPDDGLGGSDALDVYLSHAGTGGAGGAYVICDGEEADPCVDADSADGRAGTPVYIVIDPGTDRAELRRYVHHEFNHATQYATDFEEPFLSVWEGTAVAAESWTDPSYPLDPGPIADYQATPWVSAVLQDGYWLDEEFGIWSYYEYGATVWVRWLDARWGDGAGSVGPALWAALANEPGENEPDVLDAWSALAGDWRTDLPAFVADRARLGHDDGPDWAREIGEQAPLKAAKLTAPFDHPVSPGLWPLGAAYFVIEVPPGGWEVSLENADDVVIVDLSSAAEVDAADLAEPGLHRVALLHVGVSDADQALTMREPLLSVQPAGCGCASGPSPSGGVPLAVGLIAVGAGVWAPVRRRAERGGSGAMPVCARANAEGPIGAPAHSR